MNSPYIEPHVQKYALQKLQEARILRIQGMNRVFNGCILLAMLAVVGWWLWSFRNKPSEEEQYTRKAEQCRQIMERLRQMEQVDKASKGYMITNLPMFS